MNLLPAVSERTFSKAFTRALEAVPDKVAYIEADGTEWTYAETHERSLQAAAGFSGFGVGEQESVAFMLDNSVAFLQALYGLALTRRVQVPVNTAYKGDFLAHIIADCGARVLVIEDHYASRVQLVEDQIPQVTTLIIRGDASVLSDTRFEVLEFDALFSDKPAEVVEASPGDLMAIMYTSGTTGLSKGVEVNHAHAYTYSSREDANDPRSEDRILVMLPMFHLAGQWYGAYQSLIHQATCVIQPAFSVGQFWGWVRDFKITASVMLGSVAELLQQAEPQDDDADNPLRFR